MTYAISLLQRFGFFAPKADTSDAFGLRLIRIGTRESRCKARVAVFRTPA